MKKELEINPIFHKYVEEYLLEALLQIRDMDECERTPLENNLLVNILPAYTTKEKQ